jgi:hypothetical protein
MTDLQPRTRNFVIEMSVNGHPLIMVPSHPYPTAEAALDALRKVWDSLINTGCEVKSLDSLAEGGWTATLQHYGRDEPSVWRATYWEIEIDE